MAAFTIEITYCTLLGNLIAQMTVSQTVGSREEAEEVRTTMRAMPQMVDAQISIKNATPLPTVDEAVQAFRAGFSRYPVGA